MFLMPDRCGVCNAEGRSPCDACLRSLPAVPELDVPDGLDMLFALFAYERGGQRLIQRLKYRNRRGAIDWMASELAESLTASMFDCITWVPASRQGFRQRGFDTGQLLARSLSRSLGIPATRLLVRRGGQRQTESTHDQRELGPVLRVTRRAFLVKSVLLVDDVCTTGASLSTAARHLRSCGVEYVEGAVAARTPLRRAA